jgi:hypothetical protein
MANINASNVSTFHKANNTIMGVTSILSPNLLAIQTKIQQRDFRIKWHYRSNALTRHLKNIHFS